MQFMTYCAYRGRLETAFLAAELASAAAAETRLHPTYEADGGQKEAREAERGADLLTIVMLAEQGFLDQSHLQAFLAPCIDSSLKKKLCCPKSSPPPLSKTVLASTPRGIS